MADTIQQKGNIKGPMLYMQGKVQPNCFLFPTNMAEIEKLIKALKSKDSKGYDDISNRILKKIYPGILIALEIIFNKSLQ